MKISDEDYEKIVSNKKRYYSKRIEEVDCINLGSLGAIVFQNYPNIISIESKIISYIDRCINNQIHKDIQEMREE